MFRRIPSGMCRFSWIIRIDSWRGVPLAIAIIAVTAGASPSRADTNSIRVELELETGGSLSGVVVDHTPHGLVVVTDRTPYVFAWQDIKTRTAYVAKRDLLALQRGGRDHLTGEDHFELGLFALSRQRTDLAAVEFRAATDEDSSFALKVRAAFDAYRRDRDAEVSDAGPLDEWPPATAPGKASRLDVSDGFNGQAAPEDHTFITTPTTPSMHDRAREVYKAFATEVDRVMGKGVTLLETDHFLIWTDWEPRFRPRLATWSEAMYRALGTQFDLDLDEQVFLAKCPIFCWRSKTRFRRFAEHFDAYRDKNLIGYTRSIEKNGHVHIALLRQGRSESDFDRFASTLVHEGTHAFLHRLYTTRLIPNWVNEGYADMIAERVLGDRCPNRENAALLARQYVRYDWPIDRLLGSVAPIEVHEYPLAHSVVDYLESLGRDRLAGFLRSLKAGQDVAAALAGNFGGLSQEQLEADWRAAVSAAHPRAGTF